MYSMLKYIRNMFTSHKKDPVIYSLEYIEPLSYSAILDLLYELESDYQPTNYKFDKYLLVQVFKHLGQLDPIDIPYVNNYAFRYLYLSSNKELINYAKEVFGFGNIQSKSRIDLIKRIIDNEYILNLPPEIVGHISSYLPSSSSLLNLAKTQPGTALNKMLKLRSKSLVELFTEGYTSEIIRRTRELFPDVDITDLTTEIENIYVNNIITVDAIYSNYTHNITDLESKIAITGFLPLIQLLIYGGADIHNPNIIIRAAESGNLESVQWLHSQGAIIDGKVAAAASRSGNLELVEWLSSYWNFSIGDVYNQYVTLEAAYSGNLELVKWLYVRSIYFRPRDLRYVHNAVRSGSLPLFKWLVDNGFVYDDKVIFLDAVKSGNLDVVIATYNMSDEDIWRKDIYITERAAKSGSLPVVQWLYNKNFPIKDGNNRVMRLAAESGNLELVKWLYKNRAKINDKEVMSNAAKSGKLELVAWLYENGVAINDVKIINSAVDSGDLFLLEWFINKLSSTNIYKIISKYAASKGNIRILNWIYSKGANIDTNIVENAIDSGSIPLLQWIMDNGINVKNPIFIEYAKGGAKPEVLEWLQS